MEYQTVKAHINGEIVMLYPTHGCWGSGVNLIEYTDRMTHPLAWGLRGRGYDVEYPIEEGSDVQA